MKKIDFWCFLILAAILGFLGIQEFYRGETILGVLSVLFCWTMIPLFVSWIEILVWLFRGPEEFNRKYNSN